MRRFKVFVFFFITFIDSYAQGPITRLNDAVKNLEADPQLAHAILSLNVADGKTGASLFTRNAQIGLAAASCQKVITSVAAFELLGNNYRYKTELGYDGEIEGGILKGNLHVTGSGDPTLGSWRWTATTEEVVMKNWMAEIRKAAIREIRGTVITNAKSWGTATIPGGWIWEDIGNYYGAGAAILNWRENQYDLTLHSGARVGDTCRIVSTSPKLYQTNLVCEVTAAPKGSGDNAYIYLPPYASSGFVRGTIPVGESAFTISGSFPNSASQLVNTLNTSIEKAGIRYTNDSLAVSTNPLKITPLYTHLSPSLDSINYWFLKKSINLYGEALIKTIAFEKSGIGSTEKGVDIVRDFWSQRGIEKSAVHIMDGSGLSPQNRVTTDAFVKVMQYARTRPWFNSFYNALPEINGIKMKSGSIGGARSFTGYIKSSGGNEYTFAIIVNNYDGSSADMIRKMWRVLDVLK